MIGYTKKRYFAELAPQSLADVLTARRRIQICISHRALAPAIRTTGTNSPFSTTDASEEVTQIIDVAARPWGYAVTGNWSSSADRLLAY
jgi:hypothetical protein